MNTHRTPLREVVAYIGVAYALALSVALALPDANINLLLSVMVPTVTITILTFTITPRGSRKTVWRRMGLKKAAWRVWPAAIALPFILCAAAYGTALLVSAGDWDVHLADATPSWFADLAIGAVIGTLIILGEEIGWRGYLLPRMQQLTDDKRRAAVITGFIHGCFHLPLILLASTYDTETPKWIAAPMAVAVITAGGIFYAWIWDRSQSVWPVAIAHNTVNTVFDLGSSAVVGGTSVAYVAGETGWATLTVVVVAAAVLLRRAKVWREPAEASRLGAGAPRTSATAVSAA